jgi:L-asparaginase
MKIAFIQTGGTIDKDYPRKTKGYAFEIAEPAVARILQRTNPNFEYEVLTVFRKDSLEITEDDREKIFQACKDVDGDKIIVTHGTDTMIETAKKLSAIEDKTIILTGALLPERFSNSEAMFNIGAAIGAVNVIQGGVYIAMNGRVYAWDQCQRDLETGWFVEKSAD